MKVRFTTLPFVEVKLVEDTFEEEAVFATTVPKTPLPVTVRFEPEAEVKFRVGKVP